MYLRPPFMSPFSTIDTINEENKDITKIAIMEKNLKSAGFMLTFENTNGKFGTRCVATAILPTKFKSTTSN